MAAFGIVIRGKRNDGYYPVYIRVSHQSKASYIKTSFVVSDRGLKKTYSKNGKEKVEVSDTKVLRECMNEIAGYVRRLNDIDSEKMTIQEIVILLTTGETELSFSKFADEFISNMKNKGREKSATNYIMAIKRLHEYIGKEDILFSDITVLLLTKWIESMYDSSRKRNLYPTCIKAIFNAAILKYNDEDRDIIKIKKNPFTRIKIPKNRPSEKRSVEIDRIKKFFDAPIRETYNNDYTKELIAHDVCLLVFCLAGINTADLYALEHTALSNDWILRYKRKKTRDKSSTGAYTEIKVPRIIRPLFKKYKGKKRLFLWSERYVGPNDFAGVIAKGCKQVCEKACIEGMTPYSFRHSFATIAINKCGATMDEVALALNQASEHKITSIYVRPDFTRIDRLNKKVLSKVFKKRIGKKDIKTIIKKRRPPVE